jgi:hypothetical protein
MSFTVTMQTKSLFCWDGKSTDSCVHYDPKVHMVNYHASDTDTFWGWGNLTSENKAMGIFSPARIRRGGPQPQDG